jgi:hypothetical protein
MYLGTYLGIGSLEYVTCVDLGYLDQSQILFQVPMSASYVYTGCYRKCRDMYLTKFQIVSHIDG